MRVGSSRSVRTAVNLKIIKDKEIKMFAFIKLAGCIFLVLFIVLYLVFCMAFHIDVDASITISVIVSAVISILVSALMRGTDTKCPKCGKAFGMKEISRIAVDSRATTIDVERRVKNNKGEVIRTYTESVPATQYIYDCVDECKFCGHRQSVTRDITERT